MHHTLIQGCSTTGVTLQTMHPERFDEGAIIDQTPPLEIGAECETVTDLSSFLGPLGADMLVRNLQERSFIPPYRPRPETSAEKRQTRHAPKITKDDAHVDWQSWKGDEILRRQGIVGPLWNVINYPGHLPRRVKWMGGLHRDQSREETSSLEAGKIDPRGIDASDQTILLKTGNGMVFATEILRLEGEGNKPSLGALRSAFGKKTFDISSITLS